MLEWNSISPACTRSKWKSVSCRHGTSIKFKIIAINFHVNIGINLTHSSLTIFPSATKRNRIPCNHQTAQRPLQVGIAQATRTSNGNVQNDDHLRFTKRSDRKSIHLQRSENIWIAIFIATYRQIKSTYAAAEQSRQFNGIRNILALLAKEFDVIGMQNTIL